ncbi:hypothetical protein CVT24_008811, partial [Panaeolus cyanescens]
MPPHTSSQRHNSTSTPSPNDDPPPSSTSRRSKDSEGYPSWLPKRPPPPAPASTLHSSIFANYFADGDSPNPSPEDSLPVGRKPTPRSVRIVSVTDRPPETSTTRPPPKVITRPTPLPGPSSPIDPSFPSPTPDVVAFTSTAAYPDPSFAPPPQPRFNAKNLQLGLLRNPSKWMKFYYYIWPLLVFYHIPLQTFLDFNAVYMLLQVAKFPNPNTTSKNWALGAAAYVACWLVWILVVCVLYELVYSFARRWRMRRPLILPIYLSSPAFNFAAMTSYTNFSFLMYLRFSAFFNALSQPPPPRKPTTTSTPRVERVEQQEQQAIDLGIHDHEFGILTEKRDRDANVNPEPLPGVTHHEADTDKVSVRSSTSSIQQEWTWTSALSESFYLYSQNLPTIALLLPRSGLSLALLFAFSSPAPVPMLAFGTPQASIEKWRNRDQTFFKADGALTEYAKVVLWFNIAWTVWRAVVLLVAWLGLWILSDQRLAGLSGPRHIWEETANEKRRSRYGYSSSEAEAEWRASLYAPHLSPHAQGHPSHPHLQGHPSYPSHNHRRNSISSAYYEQAEDDIPWQWRDATRMRITDAFLFCLISPSRSHSRSRSRTRSHRDGYPSFRTSLRGKSGDLRWSSVSGEPVKIVNAPTHTHTDDRSLGYSTGFDY